jgi:N-acetylglucosamine-6-sulfatase
MTSPPDDEFNYWDILVGARGQGHYYNPDFKDKTGREHAPEGYCSDIIADKSLNWLSTQRDKSKPFMLMCQFKAPHVHRMPNLKNLELYEDENIPEPETLFDDYANRPKHTSTAWMKVDGMPDFMFNITPKKGGIDPKSHEYQYWSRMTDKQLDAWHKVYDKRNEEYWKLKNSGQLEGKKLLQYQYQRFIKDYLRCVASVDENVGRVLKWLKDNDLSENTVVIYSSDQGYYTGEHGWAEKRWMYEESLSMPFIIQWPDKIRKGGQRMDEMIQNIDYAPTFLEMAGLPVPEDIQGRSFLPILKGQTPEDWRKSIYYHYYAHGEHNVPRHEGVRTERYKLMHFYTDDVWEFYDLEKDKMEMKNEYENPAYADKVKELKEELRRLRKLYKV